jgi:predicted  nucleic acid-binding Zn-ribbon protein
MHPDLTNLRELETTDREIARLEEEIAALPRRVAVIEQQLAASRAQVERAQAALKEGESTRRRLEVEIKGLEEKISKYREQSLAVKTNEQYRALMHEIEFAQAAIRKCEDGILETMVAAEEQQKLLSSAQTELKRETAEIEKEKEEARRRTAEDQALLDAAASQRAELRRKISDSSLTHYDRVRKLRGSALAAAVEQKCAACNVLLRPQKYNEVRANDQILTCDSCGRILFFDPADAPAPPQPEQAASSATPEQPQS